MIQAFITNWRSTISGIALALFGILELLGIIDSETRQTLADGSTVVLDSADQIGAHVDGIIALVSGIGLLFAADQTKEVPPSGDENQ